MAFLYSDSPLRDELLGTLIGLARACFSHPKGEHTAEVMLHALTVSAAAQTETELTPCIRQLIAEKQIVAPGCAACAAPCGSTANYDMRLLWEAAPDVRAAKLWVLNALQGMAVSLTSAGTVPSPAFQEFLVSAVALLAEDLEADVILNYAVKILKSAN